MSKKEEFPVHENMIVHDGKTITKTPVWWKAVLVTSPKSYPNRKNVAIYQWRFSTKDGRWKRHAKINISSKKVWEKIKAAVEEFLGMLEEEG